VRRPPRTRRSRPPPSSASAREQPLPRRSARGRTAARAIRRFFRRGLALPHVASVKVGSTPARSTTNRDEIRQLHRFAVGLSCRGRLGAARLDGLKRRRKERHVRGPASHTCEAARLASVRTRRGWPTFAELALRARLRRVRQSLGEGGSAPFRAPAPRRPRATVQRRTETSRGPRCSTSRRL
jgi:hypothetical protein